MYFVKTSTNALSVCLHFTSIVLKSFSIPERRDLVTRSPFRFPVFFYSLPIDNIKELNFNVNVISLHVHLEDIFLRHVAL